MAGPLPVPSDWHSVAPGKTTDELKAHYGAGKKLLRRWRRETGIFGPHMERKGKPLLARRVPVPEGFAELAPTMLLVELCRHYGCGDKLIHRWLEECGVSMKAYHTPAPKHAAPRRRMLGSGFILSGPMAAQLPGPKAGREEDAAQYLRRFSAVYRCGERGAADTGGAFWRCGDSILTPDELEARARRHGWDPDEWRIIGGAPIRRAALPSFPKTQLQGAGHG